MSASLIEAIAVAAAQLVVEDGLEYAAAKRKAARKVAGRGTRSGDLPRNESRQLNDRYQRAMSQYDAQIAGLVPRNEAVEDQVRAYIATYCADTQPQELRVLRELAARWMERLATHRPHLAGAAWRGTATRRSALMIDLYCDDPKGAEIDLINQGIT